MERRTRVFLTLLISFTVIYSSVAFFLLSPPPSQPFLGFGVFSEAGTLSDYVPGAGLSTSANKTLNWHFEILNRMGVIQLARVVVRIGTNVTGSPSETEPDSSVASVGVIDRFIPDRETGIVAFSWRILSTNQTGGLVFPRVQINNGTAEPSQVGAPGGRGFRFIFELWTYDLDAGEFQYGWKSGGSVHGSWLQVWFDVAS